MAAILVIGSIATLTHAARSATERGSREVRNLQLSGRHEVSRAQLPDQSRPETERALMGKAAARSATERDTVRSVGRATARPLSADASSEGQVSDTVTRSVTPCADARKAEKWYQARVRYWAHRMGVGSNKPVSRTRDPHRQLCPQIHRAVRYWRAKAHAARLAFQRWDYEWNWQRWLPAKFYRVARCETGVDWHFDSGTYVSAFGIIRVAFPSWNGRNTPREQYEVAASIQRRYSWSAWGCGGA